MNFLRVGVVDFFGILCPGVLLTLSLLTLLAAMEAPLDLADLSKFDPVLLVPMFVIWYLFGFVLRLISPDKLDRAATWYGRITHLRCETKRRQKIKECIDEGHISRADPERRKKIRNCLEKYYDEIIFDSKTKRMPCYFWYEEMYPYYRTTAFLYTRYYPEEFGRRITREKEFHEKVFYNYLKIFLARAEPNLATVVLQAEAFVRFMSGSFWAMVVGLIAGLVYLLRNWKLLFEFLGAILSFETTGALPDYVILGLGFTLTTAAHCCPN